MKKILLLSSVITLLGTTGCLVADDRRHAHFHEEGPAHFEHHDEHFERREEVTVAPPVLVVRPPEVIVR